jgi:hypothetical protein
MLPAPDNLPLLGVAEAYVPSTPQPRVQLRLDEEDAKTAARLGATVTLTVIVDEGGESERIARLDVGFRGPEATPLAIRTFEFDGSGLRESSGEEGAQP